ncbi:MAG: sodium:solute symporter family protein [Woeseiaceae bacterium]|nr:sodium:solute symporter family protein [Woeseiaceae bacterium]
MSTQTVVFSGVSIYLLLMIVVGAYASKKTHTVTEFIVAGRSMPPLLLTTTIIATWFGGSAIMGSAGAAYDDGLLGVIADPFGAALCLVLVGLFFARLFRRLKLLTFIDFVDQRYGSIAAAFATVVSIVSNVGWVAGMLVAFGILLESLTNIPLEYGIVCGAVVVFIYTAVGGLWAVTLTDFIQMLIIMVGLVVLLAVVLVDVGGWGAVSSQLPEGRLRMIPADNTPSQWLNYLRAWLIFGIADIASSSLTQRALAARDEKTAVRSFYFGALGYLAFGMIPVTLGIIASVTMPELGDSESVIPALAIEHLHPAAIAVFVGAVLAAVMSSADSALLGAASLISNNLLPLFKKNPSDRLGLLVARLAIPVCGFVAVVIALKAQMVYDVIVDANILLLAAVIAPFILGVWWPKANRTGALAAMAAGFVAWLATRVIAPELPGDLIGLGVSLMTMLVVTPLTQTFDPPRSLVDTDGNPVELSDRLGIFRS